MRDRARCGTMYCRNTLKVIRPVYKVVTPAGLIIRGHSDCRWIAVTAELATIIDFIRYGASRFSAAGLTFGHSHDNPIDEATHLVLASLHLPPDIPPAYGAGKLTAAERENVLALI